MNCSEVRDRAEVYAVGGLPAEAAREVASHIAACPGCRLAVSHAQKVAGLLRLGVPEVEYPPSLGARLMESAHRAASEAAGSRSHWAGPSRGLRQGWLAKPSGHPRWRAGAGLAAAVLIIGINGWLALQLAALRGEVRQAEELLAENRQTTQTASEVLAKTAASGGAVARLEGTEAAPGALGTLYYSPGGYEAVFMVQGLPRLSPGEVYQLWLLRGGQRTSGGTFYPAEDGGRRLLIVRSPLPFTTFDSIGITNEPQGGSPQPRGQRHMSGPLRA
jgi:anti-sigma factor RsiW